MLCNVSGECVYDDLARCKRLIQAFPHFSDCRTKQPKERNLSNVTNKVRAGMKLMESV